MSVRLHGSVKWERDVERTPTACCSLAAHVSINAACVGDGVDSLHSRWQVVDVTSEPLSHVFSEAYAVRVEARAIQIFYHVTLHFSVSRWFILCQSYIIGLFPEPMWKSVFWQLVDSKKEKGQKRNTVFFSVFYVLTSMLFVETQASVYKKSGDLCDGLTLGCISVDDDVDDHSVYV